MQHFDASKPIRKTPLRKRKKECATAATAPSPKTPSTTTLTFGLDDPRTEGRKREVRPDSGPPHHAPHLPPLFDLLDFGARFNR